MLLKISNVSKKILKLFNGIADAKPSKVKVVILLNIMGVQGVEIHNTLNYYGLWKSYERSRQFYDTEEK